MSQVRDPEAIAREVEARRLRRAKLPAVLDYAFRPMFLAAGSWAVIALALWLAMFLCSSDMCNCQPGLIRWHGMSMRCCSVS